MELIKITGGSNGGFISALALTIIAFIIAVFLVLSGSWFVGALLFFWESVNFKIWIDSIKVAQTDADFNKANFAQFIGDLLGLIPFAEAGVATAVVVQWFGILFAFLLTNTL